MPSLLPPHAYGFLEAHTRALPQLSRESLLDYLRHGRPPGDFLTAVLSNDLTEAVGRADDVNRALLPLYVSLLVNVAPIEAWGSRDRVLAWIEAGQTMRRQWMAERQS
jgi:hypothetical protein